MFHSRDNTLNQYQLIDYSEAPPHPILAPKPIKMTEDEAHKINQAFALNNTTKRYIKLDEEPRDESQN